MNQVIHYSHVFLLIQHGDAKSDTTQAKDSRYKHNLYEGQILLFHIVLSPCDSHVNCTIKCFCKTEKCHYSLDILYSVCTLGDMHTLLHNGEGQRTTQGSKCCNSQQLLQIFTRDSKILKASHIQWFEVQILSAFSALQHCCLIIGAYVRFHSE